MFIIHAKGHLRGFQGFGNVYLIKEDREHVFVIMVK